MDLKSLILLLIVHLPMNDGYEFSYNYFNEMAQSYCASRSFGYTFAIRRDCEGIAPTCNQICTNATTDILKSIQGQRSNVACYDAINVGKIHPFLEINPSDKQPDAGKIYMKTYGYGDGGCTWTPNHCGPNYCCCKAY